MRVLLLLIAVLLTGVLSAQIVDDSTKLVYGPNTTLFITGGDLLNNEAEYQPVDTSIYLFERQSIVDKSVRRYQNLGVFGTALFPVFLTPQNIIGSTSGYSAYKPYSFDPFLLKYYDTKSPFIEVFAYLGGGNRNMVDVGFSRNVNKDWNIGFDYRRITVDKQLARNGAGDRQIVGSSFVAYTHYKHPKVPYQVVFNYSQLNHDVFELGGVRYPTTDSLRSDLFQFDNALLRLDEAQTNAKERRWYLYQDFQIAEQFQLYHQLDYQKEDNVFKDFRDGSSGTYNTYTDFYPNFFIDEDSTYQQAQFSAFTNEGGIKGDLSNIFYRAYIKLRSVDFDYNFFDPRKRTLEKYIGGYTRFKWKDKFAVTADGEYLADGGFYKIGGAISSNLVNLSYRTSKNDVPVVYDRYFGNHHEWSNSFKSVFTNELKGNVNLTYKGIEFNPKLELTTFQNYLYFDQQRQPSQLGTAVLVSSLGADLNIRFKNSKEEGWHLENEVVLTEVTGDEADVVRIPQVFYNGRLFWRGNWFGDLVPIEIGLDTHARSAYFSNNFAPETQQFFIQDEFEIAGYYKADLFVNMRLDKFFFSLKWTHVDQPTDGGYFTTPYYPGQPRSVDLIVKWMFFD